MLNTAAKVRLPWQPQSEILGNLAIGNLRNNLLHRLATQRGVHIESMLTAVGALAGFAAQNAALVSVDEIARRHGKVASGSLAIVRPKSGGVFIMGELPNTYLYEDEGDFPLWTFLARASGLRPAQLPVQRELARQVAETIGEPSFGLLHCPDDHRPSHQPIEFLKLLWSWTEDLLRMPPPSGMPPDAEPPLKEVWWPVIIATVAGQLIEMSKAMLDPALGCALAMEAAIITSKVDPKTVVPGRWIIAPGSIRRASN